MYICEGHFLAPHLGAMRDEEYCQRLIAVDTDLMVGVRLTGYNPDSGAQIIDLVKVDEVFFINVPPGLKDLVPDGFKMVDSPEQDGESK